MILPDKTGFLGLPETFDLGDPDSVLLLSTFDLSCFSLELYERFQVDRPDTLSRAVAKRQAEYLAGRTVARHAINHLGKKTSQIPRGTDRAPIWPAGLQGSLSHTHGRAACLLTSRPKHVVGVDIERNLTESGLKSVRQMTLQPSELGLLDQQEQFPEPQLAGAIFSAKETLFKALYPTVQRFFGFDAAACVALGNTSLRMELTKDLHATLPAGRAFDVEMRMLDGYIMTWLLCQE